MGSNPTLSAILRQGYGLASPYVLYIHSKKLKILPIYFGWTTNLPKRVKEHNQGLNQSKKSGIPWRLVFYAAFESEKQAKDCELYLKSGSGRSFVYKRLLS